MVMLSTTRMPVAVTFIDEGVTTGEGYALRDKGKLQ